MSERTPEELVAAGDPKGALALLQARVREHAADATLRVFLFQLLCVLGQWQRALQQLEVCAELDAATLPMVNTYREALKCETVREAVFSGRTTPMVFGQPQAWVATLIEALQAEARGDAALGARLRSDALDAAPTSTGKHRRGRFRVDRRRRFASRPGARGGDQRPLCLGAFHRARQGDHRGASDLRDLVWAPAHLWFVNGGDAVALVPARYSGTAAEGDASLQMARKTEWLEIGPEHYRGLGQRILTTSASEVGLLEVREIVLHPAAAEE